MRMVIVALSLFTVAAVTAMQANAADKPDSVVRVEGVEGVGVEGEESVAVGVEENKQSGYVTLAQAAQAARRFTRKLGRKTAIFAVFATAALCSLVAVRNDLVGPLREFVIFGDDFNEDPRDDYYEYAHAQEQDVLAAHARTAGSVWIPAGLSSLAIFSIATMLFIFWNLKKPRKAGQKGRFISIPK